MLLSHIAATRSRFFTWLAHPIRVYVRAKNRWTDIELDTTLLSSHVCIMHAAAVWKGIWRDELLKWITIVPAALKVWRWAETLNKNIQICVKLSRVWVVSSVDTIKNILARCKMQLCTIFKYRARLDLTIMHSRDIWISDKKVLTTIVIISERLNVLIINSLRCHSRIPSRPLTQILTRTSDETHQMWGNSKLINGPKPFSGFRTQQKKLRDFEVLRVFVSFVRYARINFESSKKEHDNYRWRELRSIAH